MSDPLVSVIMIFRQAAPFISEAIDSVLGQTMTDWELLLVDDGSTDQSTAIALHYARMHPDRIRYLEHDDHENLGMAASRKHGMRAARGRYLAFLDADDVFMPERLQSHVSVIERMPAPGVVIGHELYWRSWDTTNPRHPQRDFVVTTEVTPNVLFRPPELLALLLSPRSVAMPGICSITFHQLTADGLEGAPDEFTNLYEDQCLIAILLSHRVACVVDECLAKYRIHPRSATAVASSRGADRRRSGSPEHRYLIWLKSYLARHRISHPQLAAALASRLFFYEHRILGRAYAAFESTIGRVESLLVRGLRVFFQDSSRDALRRIRARARRVRVRRDERRLRGRPRRITARADARVPRRRRD
jgi:hypothetical protein